MILTNNNDSTKKNTNQTTKRNSTLEPRASTDAGLVSTKKTKQKQNSEWFESSNHNTSRRREPHKDTKIL